MAEPIVIKEHDEKEINNCDLSKLHRFLECKKMTSVLKVNQNSVETTSWVGVVKYKNIHIQILPKLIYTENYNENDYKHINNVLNNLIFMLSYTKKLNIKTNEDAKLNSSKNPFLEILIREYAKSLLECLKKLTPKQYVIKEDNLKYIKGKINFSQNIRLNVTKPYRFYCNYNEFSEDNILNQLFLFVSSYLYNISTDKTNKKLLKFIIDYYAEIQFVRFDKYNAKQIKLSRTQELFKKPFNLAIMFLEHSSIDLSKNKFDNITLVWDMNKLFEEFIFELINKNKEEFKIDVEYQKRRRLLVNDISKKRNTFVDIMIKKGNKKIVLDTKYKKFESIDDFKNEDVFQVSTYCLIHNAHNAILLYPQWSKIKPDDSFYLNIDDYEKQKPYNIAFKTINLTYENIEKNLSNIKNELSKIFA